ncbi:MAG: NUDIX hydrolase [Patescibacteria group bacterium]
MKPIQFGEKIENPLIRVSAYAVVLNEKNEVLAVKVNNAYHLPGGGIDEGEDEKEAIKRESLEEVGYYISDLELIGKANQYLPNASLGPMNKLGTFYKAKAISQDESKSVEHDHLPEWVSFKKSQELPMSEFYKWAISKVFEQI